MKDILLMVGLRSARLPDLVGIAKRSAPELLDEEPNWKRATQGPYKN